MKYKYEFEASKNFVKGDCYDCPFSYEDDFGCDGESDYAPRCVLYAKYDECPLEIVEEGSVE